MNWMGLTVFCNPPYSRGNIDKWAEKCYRESLKENTIVVALLPVSTSAIWWHKWLINKAGLIYVERRIKFIGAKFTAPFSSVIALFGEPFAGSFNQKTGKMILPLLNSEQEVKECDARDEDQGTKAGNIKNKSQCL